MQLCKNIRKYYSKIVYAELRLPYPSQFFIIYSGNVVFCRQILHYASVNDRTDSRPGSGLHVFPSYPTYSICLSSNTCGNLWKKCFCFSSHVVI